MQIFRHIILPLILLTGCGKRIVEISIDTSQGQSFQTGSYYDTQLDVPCAWQSLNGTTRCIPFPTIMIDEQSYITSGSLFFTTPCSIQNIAFLLVISSVKYATITDLTGKQIMYSTLPTNVLYQLNDHGDCVPTSSPSQNYFKLNKALPDSEFESGAYDPTIQY